MLSWAMSPLKVSKPIFRLLPFTLIKLMFELDSVYCHAVERGSLNWFMISRHKRNIFHCNRADGLDLKHFHTAFQGLLNRLLDYVDNHYIYKDKTIKRQRVSLNNALFPQPSQYLNVCSFGSSSTSGQRRGPFSSTQINNHQQVTSTTLCWLQLSTCVCVSGYSGTRWQTDEFLTTREMVCGSAIRSALLLPLNQQLSSCMTH